MKVGDLIVLSPKKTRKGLAYENELGLIIDFCVIPGSTTVLATVNFAGRVYQLPTKDLQVVKEEL